MVQGGREQQIWEQNFRKLEAFSKKHGHCNVPRRKNGDRELTQLSRWAERARGIYKRTLKGKTPLTEEQMRRLDSISKKKKENSKGKKRKRTQLSSNTMPEGKKVFDGTIMEKQQGLVLSLSTHNATPNSIEAILGKKTLTSNNSERT